VVGSSTSLSADQQSFLRDGIVGKVTVGGDAAVCLRLEFGTSVSVKA
jgi:hypothetical protein